MNDALVVNLRADLHEATSLLAAANRPKVRSHLESLKNRLEAELESLEAEISAKAAMDVVVEPPAVEQEQSSAEPREWEQINYGWDQGEYNNPWVRIYVTLEGVGDSKEGVSCDFAPDSFDLKIRNVGGKSFRLFKDRLAHEIVAEESKVVVKKNRLVVKLRKKPTEYGGFDHWSELVAKRNKKNIEKDPSAGIMDLMRDMYNDGDDNMKKVIGEAMMKAQKNPGERGLPEDI